MPDARRTAKRLAMAAAFLLMAISCGTPLAAQEAQPHAPAPPAKLLLEWGWDEPDTKFVRENIAQMEAFPFDGFVFHVAGNRGGNFTWEMWGGRSFAREEFQGAIDDLRATPFRRFTERFLRVNVTPGKTDWFDDDAWNAVRDNFRVAAHIARQGGCRGFMFDVEQYEGQLFDYRQQPARPWDDYRTKVRQRGQDWIRAINAEVPDITILLTFGYAITRPPQGQDRSQAPYGLLADFLDGVLDACAEETVIVDAWEQAYPYKQKSEFEAARQTIARQALDWTAVPEKYRRHVRTGFGLWMDYDWRQKGWDENDPTKNYFTPDEFEAAVRAAREVSDGYVWIYTEQPRWWTNQRLPPAYRQALEKAR